MEIICQGILTLVIIDPVVNIDIQNEIFNNIVFEHIGNGELHILHVGAVHNHIIETGSIIGVELVYWKGAGGGAAYNIGVIFLVVPVQIFDFCYAGVHGYIVGIPVHQNIPENAEGVHQDIQARHHGKYQDYGKEEYNNPLLG
jgi:hypothetical protein